jgi:rhodanese-related sulfurtransferase
MKKMFLLVLMVSLLSGSGLWAQCGGGDCGSCDMATSCGSDETAPVTKEAAPVAASSATTEPAKLDVAALDSLLQAKTPVILMDARSGKFDDGRRIPGAIALNADSKSEEIGAVVAAKDALIVTYCTNLECKASPKLAEHLRSLGYTNVKELPEGIEGWVAAGKTIDQPKK